MGSGESWGDAVIAQSVEIETFGNDGAVVKLYVKTSNQLEVHEYALNADQMDELLMALRRWESKL